MDTEADRATNWYQTRYNSNPYKIDSAHTDYPLNCEIISVYHRGAVIHLANKSHQRQHVDTDALPSHNLDTLQPWHPYQCILAYNIRLHNGMVFTDGSSANGRAAYSAVFQPPKFDIPLDEIQKDQLLHIDRAVHGADEDIHSYRAELAGILAAIE